MNLEHECIINNISCDNKYTPTKKKKDVSTLKDSVYYELDDHADTISDSSKPVDESNEPIKDTHVFEGIKNLSVGIISGSWNHWSGHHLRRY